jgi:hypothetical protein
MRARRAIDGPPRRGVNDTDAMESDALHPNPVLLHAVRSDPRKSKSKMLLDQYRPLWLQNGSAENILSAHV